MSVIVKYNSQTLSPTPLVSRSFNFVDYGKRFAANEQIELSCFLTGLTTPNAAIDTLTGMFGSQFKTLQVFENSGLIHQWDSTILQEVSFNESSLPVGGFVPYTVKLLSYQTPSGITDPSNEYSFTQNEDGTVNVGHKISAKGIKNSNGAFDNAVAFVKTFTGKNPFNFCTPTFAPTGSGILLNIQESINRAEGIYSVNENYKYSTGSSNNYVETTTLDINDSLNQDYTTIDLSVKWKGSPLVGNVDNIKYYFTGLNLGQKLASYNINTGNVFRNGFNVVQDSGANTIEAKANFISGLTNDFSGYFDYLVSFDQDLITTKGEWKVEGDFICKGPISFRKNRLSGFKVANQVSSYIPYLVGLITGSALYNSYASFYLSGNAIPNQITVSENTGLATLKLAASFSDDDQYAGLIKPKYSIDVDASRWIYELLPAANIEGHYTVQDLQMKNQSRMRFNMEAGSVGVKSTDLGNIYNVLGSLSGLYSKSSFITNETVSSGISDISVELELLGTDKMATGTLAAKVAGAISQNYTRFGGYKFGY